MLLEKTYIFQMVPVQIKTENKKVTKNRLLNPSYTTLVWFLANEYTNKLNSSHKLV